MLINIFHLFLYVGGVSVWTCLAAHCDIGWNLYEENCYWLQGVEEVSFSEAIHICANRNSFSLQEDALEFNLLSFLKIRYDSLWARIWVKRRPLFTSKEEDGCLTWDKRRWAFTYLDCTSNASVVCWKNPNVETARQNNVERNTSQFSLSNITTRPALFRVKRLSPNLQSHPLVAAPSKCKTGDFLILESCYHMGNNEMLNWEQANEYCQNYSNGYLFSINNRHELEAVMNETKLEVVWLGLKFENNSHFSSSSFFQWSSGEQNAFFWWWEVDLDAIDSSECFSTSLRTTDVQTGILNAKKCSEKVNFICEYNKIEGNSDVYKVVDYNGWLNVWYNSKYMKYVKIYAKWKEAEWSCNSAGAHLVNFFRASEVFRSREIARLRIKDTLFWTGNYLERNNSMGWTGGEYSRPRNDGSEHPNATFSTNEETSSLKEYCVAYNTKTTTVTNYRCDAYLSYLCLTKEKKNIKSIIMPTPPSFERCTQSNWFKFNSSCYKIYGNNSDTMTWKMAAKYCEKEGATLASITSYAENNWLSSLVYQYPRSHFWIGGRRRNSGFYWNNNFPLLYTYWNKGEPNNYEELDNCISLNSKMGCMWNDEHCSEKYGFICKKLENSNFTIDKIVPSRSNDSKLFRKDDIDGEIEQTYNLDGKQNPEYSFCGGEWLKMGSRCIYIGNISLPFKESLEYCRSLHKYGNLVSLHSMKDQATLNFWMLSKATGVWIGWIFNHPWTDGSEPNFQNFDASSYWVHTRVVESLGLPSYGGRWMYRQGGISLVPACSKPYYESEHINQYCSSPYDNFHKEKDSCYLFVEEKKTWKEAEEFCTSQHSHLLWIDDYDDQSYIWYKSFDITDHDIWIGLKVQQNIIHSDKEKRYFKWSNSRYIIYTNWAERQPIFHGRDSCSAFHIQSGKWFMHPCVMEKSFICRHNTGKSPTTSLVKGNCPSVQWMDSGGKYCYYFENNNRLSWHEAARWCNKEGGHLASIHSTEENYLVSLFVRSTNRSAWIGLHRTLIKDFIWSDWSKVNFEAWANNEPSETTKYLCVVLNEERYWIVEECKGLRSLRPFICKSLKYLPHTVENMTEIQKPENMTEIQKPENSSGCPIMIVVSVLLILFGGITYLVWRKFSTKNKKTLEITNRISLGELETTTIYSNDSSDEGETAEAGKTMSP